jgi:hypothetical protein
MTNLKLFTVRAIHSQAFCGVGPFVVRAKSPRGAFRKVRNTFPQFLRNHVAREYMPLECDGIISDRTGELLGYRTDKRLAYDSEWKNAAESNA